MIESLPMIDKANQMVAERSVLKVSGELIQRASVHEGEI
jgi:hypothetical protein